MNFLQTRRTLRRILATPCKRLRLPDQRRRNTVYRDAFLSVRIGEPVYHAVERGFCRPVSVISRTYFTDVIDREENSNLRIVWSYGSTCECINAAYEDDSA